MEEKENKQALIIGIIISIIIIAITIIFVLKFAKKATSQNTKDNEPRLTYKVPAGFKKTYSNGDYIAYSYDGDSADCHYTSYSRDYVYYENGKDYIEDNFIMRLNDKVEEIKEEEINGVLWYYISKKSVSGDVEYNYVAKSNNKFYVFEYTIYDRNNGDYPTDNNEICYKSLNEIVSSFEIK